MTLITNNGYSSQLKNSHYLKRFTNPMINNTAAIKYI